MYSVVTVEIETCNPMHSLVDDNMVVEYCANMQSFARENGLSSSIKVRAATQGELLAFEKDLDD